MKSIIVPDKQKTEQLFKQLNLSAAESAALVFLQLSQIEIDAELGTWTLVGKGKLDDAIQKKVAEQLEKTFGLKKVEFLLTEQVAEKKKKWLFLNLILLLVRDLLLKALCVL